MKIKIHVTKEIYQRSWQCGAEGTGIIGNNCAVALAVREICPGAFVSNTSIFWIDQETGLLCRNTPRSSLPAEVQRRVADFDSLGDTNPERRLSLGEFSFVVDFPDELVDKIGINEVQRILSTSDTLKPVEA